MSHGCYVLPSDAIFWFFSSFRVFHTVFSLRTRCMQTHRRFPLYACQFLNERELVVLPLKYSYFLLFIKVGLCLKGKSHSFCSIKSSCALQREQVLERSWVLPWNNFLVIGKQKFWSKSWVLVVLSTGCLCSRYGCFPDDIYH